MRHEQFEHQNVANTAENERFKLQNVANSSWNGSFQRQHAANSKGNGQDRRSKKNPTRKQNNSQNNSGPISSKRKDYMNENGVGGHFIVWELFEPHVARRMAPTLASSSHLRFSAAAQSLAEPCLWSWFVQKWEICLHFVASFSEKMMI